MLTFHGLQVNATYDKYALWKSNSTSSPNIIQPKKKTNNFVNIFLVKNSIVQLKKQQFEYFFQHISLNFATAF